MNQKGIQGQNDSVSNIIGNLPKRLQQKIAVDCSIENEGESLQISKPTSSNRIGSEIEDPLKRERTEIKTPTKTDNIQTAKKFNEKYIPGIIRLQINESQNFTNVRDKQSRSNTEQRIPRNVHLYNTPIQNQKLYSYPTWYNDLNFDFAKQLPKFHDIIINFLQHGSSMNDWQIFWEAHKELKEIFTKLLLTNLKFSCEQKVDTFFWKFLFYNIREQLLSKNSKEAHNSIILLLNDGIQFYTNLRTQLTKKYFNKSENSQSNRKYQKYKFIAKLAIQKLLICLGDLHRYKIKQLDLKDYSEVVKLYQEARLLIPTNGIPYNQLAVVSILVHKKFDACYYHMRSLMSSNAIHSARESLLVLFDEIRKKHDDLELKLSPIHQIANNKNNLSKSMRKEIWIFPDGIRRVHHTNMNNIHIKVTSMEEKQASEMSPEELLHSFTSLYLLIIAKLYTSIGMETIQESQRKMLLQFKVLLNQGVLSKSNFKLLKIAALNIFIMEYNIHTDLRREIRYHAFNFCNQMFGLVLKKCNEIYLHNEENLKSEQVFKELNVLFQFINIYTTWLSLNVAIWEPIRDEEHIYSYCWSELQLLTPKIRNYLNGDIQAQQDIVMLEEEEFLLGFTPLASLLSNRQIHDPKKPLSDIEQFHSRILKIFQFEEIYRNNQKSLEKSIDSEFGDEKFSPMLSNEGNNLNNHINENNGHSLSVVQQKYLRNEIVKCRNGNESMNHLLKLKNELQAKSNVKKQYDDKLEEILNVSHSSVDIEVRPKYLLPDTNCFIDGLEDFEDLNQQSNGYVLMVPLTVVKELDGLSKGVKIAENHRIHHFDDVSTRAKKALNFIKSSKNYVKCATIKGSIIQASLFHLVEEEFRSNDDKILATALALSKNLSNETNKNGKTFIRTELVLITTDRNLRVKALSRNLSVSDMNEFLQWAKATRS